MWKDAFGRGDHYELNGMPMTTDNLCNAASTANDDPNNNSEYTVGVGEVASDLIKKFHENFPNIYEMEKETELVQHPVEGEKPMQVFKVPDAVLTLLNGKFRGDVLPEDENQVEPVVEEDKETGIKKVHYQQSPGKKVDISELTDSGMKEAPVGPSATPSKAPAPATPEKVPDGQLPQEKVDLGKDKGGITKKDKEKGKEKAKTSTTDYLYNFLQSNGIVDDKGILKVKQAFGGQPVITVLSEQREKVNEQAVVKSDQKDQKDQKDPKDVGVKPSQPVQPVKTENTMKDFNKSLSQKPEQFDSLEQHGTYYANKGQCLIMSIDPDVPTLKFI